MNETSFRISISKAYKIVIRYNALERLYLPDPDNRESIISVETICADSLGIPLIVIISMQIYFEGTFRDLHEDILISISDSRYLNDELNLDWIHYFNKFIKKKS
jgi:hypothetical protein